MKKESWAMCGRMATLAETFPTLVGLPGLLPWDSVLFAEQLGSPAITNARASAILFVLSVWNTGFQGVGVDLIKNPFDVHSAMLSWDNQHRRAFLAWVADPFWV
jgi:hypothetical protein